MTISTMEIVGGADINHIDILPGQKLVEIGGSNPLKA